MTSKIRRRNLPLLLSQAREAAMANFRPILNDHGLTEQQWRIIRALSEQAPLEPRQIGRKCQILSPSLTGILSRMEELQLISRDRHGEDLRRMLISLTPKSEALIEQIAPLVQARYKQLEGAVGRELLDRLYAVLDEFLAVCETPTVQMASPLVVPTPTHGKQGKVSAKLPSARRRAQSIHHDKVR